MTDFELLQAWQAGDRSAGNRLLERYFASLYRFFRNKVDQGVDDLIQETFLALTKYGHNFRGDGSFRAFLFVVARNELYRYLRKHRRRPEEPVDFEQVPLIEIAPSPSSVVGRTREERLLLKALRAIPLELQVTVEMHYWEGMSTSELAAVLEIPQGTVKSRLRRARAALAEKMKALAESAEQYRSTVDDLDGWAERIRANFDPGAQDAGSSGHSGSDS